MFIHNQPIQDFYNDKVLVTILFDNMLFYCQDVKFSKG